MAGWLRFEAEIPAGSWRECGVLMRFWQRGANLWITANDLFYSDMKARSRTRGFLLRLSCYETAAAYYGGVEVLRRRHRPRPPG